MITNVKKIIGDHDENLGKWVKVTPDEEEAIRESMIDVNYARGAQNKLSLRIYSLDGYVVICTTNTTPEAHPTATS